MSKNKDSWLVDFTEISEDGVDIDEVIEALGIEETE